MPTKIQLRRDTATNWASTNPILAPGEKGLELDTGKEKNGNGITDWNSLDYIDSDKPEISSGTVAPTSTPAKIGDIYVDTVLNHTYIAKGTSSSTDWIKQSGSYLIQATAASLVSPADANSYYWGAGISPLSITTDIRRLYVPRAGIITSAYVHIICATGSNETSSVFIRVNNTTDYLITNAVDNSSSPFRHLNNSMNIPVNVGDYIEFKWKTPTWATNPTNISIYGQVLIDL